MWLNRRSCRQPPGKSFPTPDWPAVARAHRQPYHRQPSRAAFLGHGRAVQSRTRRDAQFLNVAANLGAAEGMLARAARFKASRVGRSSHELLPFLVGRLVVKVRLTAAKSAAPRPHLLYFTNQAGL
jgi:hypothetical protein